MNLRLFSIENVRVYETVKLIKHKKTDGFRFNKKTQLISRLKWVEFLSKVVQMFATIFYLS
jgi:hypothetical protein